MAALRLLRDLRGELAADHVGDFAASLAYRFLLALFPFFIFVGALGGLIASTLAIENPATAIVDRLATTLPADTRTLLSGQLAGILQQGRGGLASVAIVAAVWAAAGGVSTTMRALNAAYDVEETRPLWERTVIALGLTLVSGGLLMVAFVVGVAGRTLGEAAARALDLRAAWATALVIVQYVLPPALLLVGTGVIYWAAPSARPPFRWVTPGALVFVGTWVVARALFDFYVANLGTYANTYGALGAVVVLLLWFYLSAYMLLVGAEVNALLARAATGAPQARPSEPVEARSERRAVS